IPFLSPRMRGLVCIFIQSPWGSALSRYTSGFMLSPASRAGPDFRLASRGSTRIVCILELMTSDSKLALLVRQKKCALNEFMRCELSNADVHKEREKANLDFSMGFPPSRGTRAGRKDER